MLADVTHGGARHIGVLTAPGIPEMLLAGRERAFLTGYAIPSTAANPDAFTDTDVDELVRSILDTLLPCPHRGSLHMTFPESLI
jgi:hypothetical protein